ncbi:MAG: riboflavin synthase [Pseudomonadota bacterium]|nr:riboflavin synthase [Pseudomonadota bacterium]
MFTGIITDIGSIVELHTDVDLRLKISCNYSLSSITIGGSIAHDGICLTVTDKGIITNSVWYAVEVSSETQLRTSIGKRKTTWHVGRSINLERSLKVGDELGGHIVTGHVDGVAKILDVVEIGQSTRIKLQAPNHLSQFIATKGSVALNGTSLTVNEVEGSIFQINLIPHTKRQTTWNSVKIGDFVNLEIDTLARYVARLKEIQ